MVSAVFSLTICACFSLPPTLDLYLTLLTLPLVSSTIDSPTRRQLRPFHHLATQDPLSHYHADSLHSFIRVSLTMAGGKGKSIGGKASGAKDSTTKPQKSHSAKAGLQVRPPCSLDNILAHSTHALSRHTCVGRDELAVLESALSLMPTSL